MEKTTGARILIVEDDRKIAQLVELYLSHDGYRVSVEHDGTRALERVRAETFDLLVLDVMLPGVNGLELCREVRRQGPTPVILLTARTLEEERVAGLELGADDYVCKPFSPRELVARVSAVLRRVPPDTGKVLKAGDVALDLTQRTVSVRGEAVDLTPSELALLQGLIEKPGRVLSRAQLLRCLPGEGADAFDRTVDAHVKNLRKKLDADPAR